MNRLQSRYMWNWQFRRLITDKWFGVIGCWDEDLLHPSGSNWFRQDCSICVCDPTTDTVSCKSSTDDDLCPEMCTSTLFNITDEFSSVNKCCKNCGSTNITTTTALVAPSASVQHKVCQHQLYPNVHFKSG